MGFGDFIFVKYLMSLVSFDFFVDFNYFWVRDCYNDNNRLVCLIFVKVECVYVII